mmetsp:Transcript_7583/g.20979  ORF Transcript_7583/g.20979 Transcript_7583/m.20979 type:complete len:296 (-) Transcript_7583:206-1093(-)
MWLDPRSSHRSSQTGSRSPYGLSYGQTPSRCPLHSLLLSAFSLLETASALRRMAPANDMAPGSLMFALRMASRSSGNPPPCFSIIAAHPRAAPHPNFSDHDMSTDRRRFARAAFAACSNTTCAPSTHPLCTFTRRIRIRRSRRMYEISPIVSSYRSSSLESILTPTSHSKSSRLGHASNTASTSRTLHLPLSPSAVHRSVRSCGDSRARSRISPRFASLEPVTSRTRVAPHATPRRVHSAACVAAPRRSISRHAASARCPPPSTCVRDPMLRRPLLHLGSRRSAGEEEREIGDDP